MLQLIINLNDKNKLLSRETASGKWAIYVEKNKQRDKIEEKYFSSYDMESELENAVRRLDNWSRRTE